MHEPRVRPADRGRRRVGQRDGSHLGLHVGRDHPVGMPILQRERRIYQRAGAREIGRRRLQPIGTGGGCPVRGRILVPEGGDRELAVGCAGPGQGIRRRLSDAEERAARVGATGMARARAATIPSNVEIIGRDILACFHTSIPFARPGAAYRVPSFPTIGPVITER